MNDTKIASYKAWPIQQYNGNIINYETYETDKEGPAKDANMNKIIWASNHQHIPRLWIPRLSAPPFRVFPRLSASDSAPFRASFLDFGFRAEF